MDEFTDKFSSRKTEYHNTGIIFQNGSPQANF